MRKASLKVESGQQVIRETAHCGSNDQRAEIATDGRLREALVSVTWDDDFEKRREREARRLHSLESGPEVEVLKRPMVGAIVQVGRLTIEAGGVRDGSLITHLHVRKRRVDSEALGQSVLDVTDKGVSVG